MKKIFIMCFLLLLLTGCKAKENNSKYEGNDNILEDIATNLSNDYSIKSLDKNILSGEYYEIDINDDFTVKVYVYPSEEDAINDVNRLSDDGQTYVKKQSENTISTFIDWIKTPHFFQYKNSIILYLGANQDILEQLSNKFGEQTKPTVNN